MHIILFAGLLAVGLGQMGGGWTDQNPKDPDYTGLLNAVVANQLTAVPDGYTLTAVKSQVVAGMNYEYTFTNPSGMTCVIRIFEQSWTKTRDVTHDTCKSLITGTRNARAGGWAAQNPSDQKWTDLLNKLETSYGLLDMSNNNNVTIIDIQTQVVAGMNYKYTLNVDGKTCSFVYFEQVWTNTHQINGDTCNLSAKKRAVGMPGGYFPQDPTDQKWATLLNGLDSDGLLDMPDNKTIEIVSVGTQVVAGINTHFVLKVDGHLCEMTYFSQSWTNTKKISQDTCNLKVTHTRQLGVTGGWAPQNPDQQKWMEMLHKLDKDYNIVDLSSACASTLQILHVSQQVVSGYNYEFTIKVCGKTCKFVYYEQSWTNTHQISSDTCGIKSNKRAVGMPGGYFPQDPTDQKWTDLLSTLNTGGLLDMSGNHTVNIVSVGTQVVSGINTMFVLNVDGQKCELLYYSQPWTSTEEIKKDTCGLKVTSKRQLGGTLAGGWSPKDPTDQKWDDLLNSLDTQYNLIQLNNGTNGVEILAVETQVVAGENYKFKLKMNGKICYITYFEQVWANTRKITEDTCHIKVTQKKRYMMVGGYTAQDLTDSKWMDILNKFQTDKVINLGGANDLKVLKVQQQVVAGFNYKYTLFMNGRVCELTLFEQVWTNTRQVLNTTCTGVKVTRALFNTNTATQTCMGAILDRINAMSNSLFRLVNHHTTQTQVMSNGAEVNYHVQMVLTESDCMNSGDTSGYTAVQCPPKQGSPIHTTWTADCRYDNTGTPAQVSNLNMVSN